MSPSTIAKILQVIDEAGEAIEVACPQCNAIVNLGEQLVQMVAATPTEAEQVKAAEDAIIAADMAAAKP
jgi:hypothetical protein